MRWLSRGTCQCGRERAHVPARTTKAIWGKALALLIDIRQPEWMSEEALRDELAPLLPGVTIHAGFSNSLPASPMDDVIMVAAITLHPGVVAALPNLELVQKLGAGVDGIVKDPSLRNGVRVTRLAPDAPADEIAQYCLAYVLRTQRNIDQHDRDATIGNWNQIAPKRNSETVVAVLGLGHIGARTARLFANVGFKVIGWSRSQKSINGVTCLSGMDTLEDIFAQADYVASILPSTPQTVDLVDAERLRAMKPTAILINAGRGDLIVETDLLEALDAGVLAGAVLDVFRTEPLPSRHPFWRHPKITVTPHVSGWHIDDGLKIVAENYRRLQSGEPLLHEIDRTRGY